MSGGWGTPRQHGAAIAPSDDESRAAAYRFNEAGDREHATLRPEPEEFDFFPANGVR